MTKNRLTSDGKEIPSYVELNEEEGTAIVKFARPVSFSGEMISSVTLREPLMIDIEKSSMGTMDVATQEIRLFAALCGFDPDTVRGMTARNYSRLSAAFGLFTD